MTQIQKQIAELKVRSENLKHQVKTVKKMERALKRKTKKGA